MQILLIIRHAFWLFAAVILAVAALATFLIYQSWPLDNITIDRAALLGDSFGILNALFSGLAFAGLIITVLLQRQELKESREIFSAQKFEDAFYRLLEFYSRNLNEIKMTDPQGNELSGVGVLSYVLQKFKSSTEQYNDYIVEHPDIYKLGVLEEIQKSLVHQSRYIGTIESILSLVENDIGAEKEEAEFYIKLTASQLTVHEVKYIFFRCLVSSTESLLVKLVCKSQLLTYRINELDLNETIVNYFNEIHGTHLYLSSQESSLPYTSQEIDKIKTEFRRLKNGHDL
jgi:hypothetical protein